MDLNYAGLAERGEVAFFRHELLDLEREERLALLRLAKTHAVHRALQRAQDVMERGPWDATHLNFLLRGLQVVSGYLDNPSEEGQDACRSDIQLASRAIEDRLANHPTKGAQTASSRFAATGLRTTHKLSKRGSGLNGTRISIPHPAPMPLDERVHWVKVAIERHNLVVQAADLTQNPAKPDGCCSLMRDGWTVATINPFEEPSVEEFMQREKYGVRPIARELEVLVCLTKGNYEHPLLSSIVAASKTNEKRLSQPRNL